MSNSTSKPVPKPRRDRSPNYPALTFTDAVEKTGILFEKEKKHPIPLDVAAQHLGWSNAKNGAFQPAISALRKYGLVENVGADVRVTDDAAKIFIYPKGDRETVEVMQRLVMKPALFGEVLAKFQGGLPSDETLRAKLRAEWNFASVAAADTFIRALRNAVAVRDGLGGAPVDAPVTRGENGAGSDPEEERSVTPNDQSGRAKERADDTSDRGAATSERHSWKLGDGVWADIRITGTLTARAFEKLKRYVDLIDVTEDDG